MTLQWDDRTEAVREVERTLAARRGPMPLRERGEVRPDRERNRYNYSEREAVELAAYAVQAQISRDKRARAANVAVAFQQPGQSLGDAAVAALDHLAALIVWLPDHWMPDQCSIQWAEAQVIGRSAGDLYRLAHEVSRRNDELLARAVAAHREAVR